MSVQVDLSDGIIGILTVFGLFAAAALVIGWVVVIAIKKDLVAVIATGILLGLAYLVAQDQFATLTEDGIILRTLVVALIVAAFLIGQQWQRKNGAH